MDEPLNQTLRLSNIPTDRAIVPAKQALTFKLKLPSIDFNLSPQSIKLPLENTSSTTDHYFVIQVSHPQYYTVSPAYGSIERLKAAIITVTFKPIPMLPSGRIKAYLYVRLRNGFPVERYCVTNKAFVIRLQSPSSPDFQYHS